MKADIVILKGDGIGPEVTDEAVRVLEAVAAKFGHSFSFSEYPFGGYAYDLCGAPLPEKTLNACKCADAVLLGAVGGKKWESLSNGLRPEDGLLSIRKEMGLYANLRPAVLFDGLKYACPLKPEIIGEGIDIMVVRELTGGIYFGSKGSDGDSAYDTEYYSASEIERVARRAFSVAAGRRKSVVSVDKANVLESSRLWRRTVMRVAEDYPEISLRNMYADNAAMQLVRAPSEFDVILTSNMFGDILSDEAGMVAGSIGVLPSACLGAEEKPYLFEPVHGSAPDIAGKGIANPVAAILSAAMMLEYSFSLCEESKAVFSAVRSVLAGGFGTPDILGAQRQVGTSEMGRLIAEAC